MEHLSKAELRNYFKCLDIPFSNQRSGSALELLLPLLPKKGWILSYSSLPEEVDTKELNAYLMERGQLALPKIQEKNRLSVHPIYKETGFIQNRLGVHEPLEARFLEPKELVLVLVPAVAFDQKGNRLGRGGGYYDRFLTPFLPTIGLSFKERVVGTLPHSPHDQPVDMLVTV